jgi:hypothetical protein
VVVEGEEEKEEYSKRLIEKREKKRKRDKTRVLPYSYAVHAKYHTVLVGQNNKSHHRT